MPRRLRLLVSALLLLGFYCVAAPPAGAASLFEAGDVAVVSTTEGDQLAVRGGPGLDFAVLIRLPAGTSVQVLDGPAYADNIAWYQVSSGAYAGWSSGEWLAPPTANTGTSYIGGTDGGGARLRDEPGLSSAILLYVPEGGAVVLLGTAARVDDLDWELVRYGGTAGWIAAGFLGGTPAGQGGGPTTATTATATPLAGGGVTVGDYAIVTGSDGQDVRVRYGPGRDADILSFLRENTVVRVVNGPLYDSQGGAWYGIAYGDLEGWVFGSYLAQTVNAMSMRSGPPAYDAARGAAIVAEALTHLDVPYIWGGDGPRGWDCSGMVQWLYATVAGVQLPRVSQDQFLVGTPLSRDEIRAGDILFFADTDGPGITHNGIALGDGRFIHARDESRGTMISSIDDQPFVDHYAGARRP